MWNKVKYIKLFEDLNTDGYEEIEYENLYPLIYNPKNSAYQFDSEAFTQKELDILQSRGFSYKTQKDLDILHKLMISSDRNDRDKNGNIKLSLRVADKYYKTFDGSCLYKEIIYTESFPHRGVEALLIFKSSDEWYYIECITIGAIPLVYKCDQMYGLLNCLKKEFRI